MFEPGIKKNDADQKLAEMWCRHWQEALNLWGTFVRLPEPVFCTDPQEERKEGLTQSFAMIRLGDHRIILSSRVIMAQKLEAFALEIIGHEIGHHVYCPADLVDLGRMMARIRKALPSLENYAPMVGNLYTDLLINDRLFRSHHLKMDQVYKKLEVENPDPLWTFYMRTYEILWGLPKGSLAKGKITPEMEADAILGNRVIRNYAREWVRGSGRFAALCFPYLAESAKKFANNFKVLMDSSSAAGNEVPGGLTDIDEDEELDAVHPALEGEGASGGSEGPEEKIGKKSFSPTAPDQKGGSGKSHREPFEYGQILKAMGIDIDGTELAYRYYKERALPYLVPFPVKESPVALDPLPEGLDPWEFGSPLERINWLETIIRSPVVIPGVTTLETHFGTEKGSEKAKEPVDLDIYIDCSGSMPNPRMQLSYLALAGVIIVLSALRAGSRVQATLWSGPGEFKTTAGFKRNERDIMAIITDYIGGCTAFPLHILRDTYQDRKPFDRKVHILHISDSGIDTLFQDDEKGNSGKTIAALALEKAGAGGTMALNLFTGWEKNSALQFAKSQGWKIFPVRDWRELIAFSKEFAGRHYISRGLFSRKAHGMGNL